MNTCLTLFPGRPNLGGSTSESRDEWLHSLRVGLLVLPRPDRALVSALSVLPKGQHIQCRFTMSVIWSLCRELSSRCRVRMQLTLTCPKHRVRFGIDAGILAGLFSITKQPALDGPLASYTY